MGFLLYNIETISDHILLHFINTHSRSDECAVRKFIYTVYFSKLKSRKGFEYGDCIPAKKSPTPEKRCSVYENNLHRL